MIMTLNVQESGRIKYIERPGATLEAGCVVARLDLDDPSKVHPVCYTPAQPPWLAQECSLFCQFWERSWLNAPSSCPASVSPQKPV